MKDADLPDHVSQSLRPIYRRIVELTDAFCDAHLNAEYKDLCRAMAAALCRAGSPAATGKPQGWAAGVVYTVGWANFLSDPSQKPHLKSAQIAKGFAVSMATMAAKSKVLREGLRLTPLDPAWTLPSRLDRNPLVWMLKVNGLLMDIRRAPRGAQEEAYRLGLIPYIPADREGNDPA